MIHLSPEAQAILTLYYLSNDNVDSGNCGIEVPMLQALELASASPNPWPTVCLLLDTVFSFDK